MTGQVSHREGDDAPPQEHEEEEEELIFEEDEPESDGEGNLTYLLFDQSREYTEEETQYIWAYNSAYRDVRKDLQARRKGRQYFKPKDSAFRNKKGGGKGSNKSRFSSKGRPADRDRDRKNKGSPGDLMAKTRCFRCDELGHMSKDCPKRESVGFFVVQGSKGSVNKTFVSTVGSITPENVSIRAVTDECSPDMSQLEDSSSTNRCFVNIATELERSISVLAGVHTDGHEAIVDTAAEEAVVGSTAMQKLRMALAKHGLQPVAATGASVSCSGIGGAAKIAGVWDIPLGVARTNGLIRTTEVEDQGSFCTPFLLPISYQELVGATIDLDKSILRLRNGRKTMMKRTPSGHRSISVLEFNGRWSLPDSLKSELKIGVDNPFLLPADKKSDRFQQKPGVAVWLKKGQETIFMGLLDGPRRALVHSHEVFPTADLSQLGPSRSTHAMFLDHRSMTITDLWGSVHSRQLPLWSGDVFFEFCSPSSSSLTSFSPAPSHSQAGIGSQIGEKMQASPLSSSAQQFSLQVEDLSGRSLTGDALCATVEPCESLLRCHATAVDSVSHPQIFGSLVQAADRAPDDESQNHRMHQEGRTRDHGDQEGRASHHLSAEDQCLVPDGAFDSEPHYPCQSGVRGQLPDDQAQPRGDARGRSCEGRQAPTDGAREGAAEESRDQARNWATAFSIGRLQDLAVRASQMCPSRRPFATESRPRSFLVDMSRLWLQMGASRSLGGQSHQPAGGKFKLRSSRIAGGDSQVHIHHGMPSGIASTPVPSGPQRSDLSGRIHQASQDHQGLPHGSARPTALQDSGSHAYRQGRTVAIAPSSTDQWTATISGEGTAEDPSGIARSEGAVRDPLFRGGGQPLGRGDGGDRDSFPMTNQSSQKAATSPTTKGTGKAALLSVLVYMSVFHQKVTGDQFLQSLGTMEESSSPSEGPSVDPALFQPKTIKLTPSTFELGSTDFDTPPQWLGKQDRAILANSIRNYVDHCAELFSPPRIVPVAKKAGLRASLSMDLTTGYDFLLRQDRERAWREIKKNKPAIILLCPPCRTFSPLRFLSTFRRNVDQVREEEAEGDELLDFALDVIDYQLSQGRGFLFEHPKPSQAWKKPRMVKLLERPDVFRVIADMCQFGLRVAKGPLKGLPAQKRSGLVSNVIEVLDFVNHRCQKEHRHGKLIGGVAQFAQEYTPTFVQSVVCGIKEALGFKVSELDRKGATNSPKQQDPGRKTGRAIGAILHQYAVETKELEELIPNEEEAGSEECLRVESGGSHSTTPDDRPLKSTSRSSLSSSSSLKNSSKQSSSMASIQRMTSLSRMTSTSSRGQRKETSQRSPVSWPVTFEDDEEYTPSMAPENPEDLPQPPEEGFSAEDAVRARLRDVRREPKVQEALEQVEDFRKVKEGEFSLAPHLRREVHKVHRNLGHPAKEVFLRAMRHSGVKHHVLDWVRHHFRCPACQARERPNPQRPGHLLRALEFGQIVGLDLLYIEIEGELKTFLNMLDWGTNFQQAALCQNRTAQEVQTVFLNQWVQHYGPPIVAVTDQGPEFTGQRFQEVISGLGATIHYTNSQKSMAKLPHGTCRRSVQGEVQGGVPCRVRNQR